MNNRKLMALGWLNLLVIASSVVAATEPADVTIDIHADQTIGKISPYIYGINSAEWTKTPDVTFSRQGGNRMTAWNWENNASNAGRDWHNQSDDYLGGGDTPGEVLRLFLAPAMQRGKSAIITVPMAGYVAADKNPPGDVNQTPDYLQKRFEPVLPKKNSPFQFPPDLTDHAVYDDEMVWWINKEFPADKRHGGEIFYDLDNEPDIWQETHSRIHPDHVTYAEMVKRTTDYAGGIKDVLPDAVIFGFVSYGWNGYRTLQNAPDADDRDFIDFYLDSMKDVEKQQKRRLLDVLDLHWYPEAKGGAKRIVDATAADPAIVQARVQAPRSLWDPNYKENSWIVQNLEDQPIRLLPRMFDKIQQHYPGTKLAFTEYDYGGVNHISGAVAEADVLGIFGSSGVFAAAHWGNTGSFMLGAFEAYRNYDNKGGTFGDTALQASSSKVEDVSVYASKFESGKDDLVVVLINRSTGPRKCQLNVSGFDFTKMKTYRLAADSSKIKSVGTKPAKPGEAISLPSMSVTTLVLQK
jgi:hypothetical protein